MTPSHDSLGQPAASPLPPPDEAAKIANDWLAHPQTHSPSLTIAAFNRSGIVWSGGFGMADVEKAVAATATTRYHFASITKVHTTLILAMMADKGLLGIDDPVIRYIPEFNPRYAEPGSRPITLRDLATHSSGLTNFWGKKDHSLSETELLDGLQAHALAIQPGYQYKYSNYGIAVLGLVLAKVAGKPYECLLREWIINPLAMAASGFDELYHNADLARGYDVIDGKLTPLAPSRPFNAHAPSSAIVSTVEDIARFGIAHLSTDEQSTVPPRIQDVLFTAHSSGTGLGWHYHGGEFPRWWHLGAWNGHYSRLVIRPDIGVGLALATNASWGPDPVVPLVRLLAPHADTSHLKALCGEYSNGQNTVHITLPDDPSLTLELDTRQRLIPISRHSYHAYEDNQPTATWVRFIVEDGQQLMLLEAERYVRFAWGGSFALRASEGKPPKQLPR